MAKASVIDQFLASTCEWLRGTGPESDIVLSSRIRLARNLSGFHFSEKLESTEQQHLIEEVEKAIGSTALLKDSYFLDY